LYLSFCVFVICLPLRELLQDCCYRDDWASPLEDGALILPARQEAAHRRLQLRRRCLDAIQAPIEDTITVLLWRHKVGGYE